MFQEELSSFSPRMYPGSEGNLWAGKTPRRWQEEALAVAMNEIHNDDASVIRACTGAGKSLLQSELCARLHANLTDYVHDRILVTVPTQKLVDQMYHTMRERMPGKVGRYFANAKDMGRQIVILCHASISRLAKRLLAVNHYNIKYWIADECHQTNSKQFEWMERLEPTYRLGFTATPYLSTGRKDDVKAYLNRWKKEIYSYGINDAVRDGCIMHPTLLQSDMDDIEVNDAALHMIEAHTDRRWGAVNAISIEDADEFAAYARGRGFVAESYHSKLTERTQKSRMKRFVNGDIQFLVYVNMLSEGVDFPWLRWLCLRRPPPDNGLLNMRRYVQEVGRVLRPYRGKDKAIVIDLHSVLNAAHLDVNALFRAMDGDIEALEGKEEEEKEKKSRAERDSRTLLGSRLKSGNKLDFWFNLMIQKVWHLGCPECPEIPEGTTFIDEKMKEDLREAFRWLSETSKDEDLSMHHKFHWFNESDWNALRWIFVYFRDGELSVEQAHFFLYLVEMFKDHWWNPFYFKRMNMPSIRSLNRLSDGVFNVPNLEDVEFHMPHPKELGREKSKKVKENA